HRREKKCAREFQKDRPGVRPARGGSDASAVEGSAAVVSPLVQEDAARLGGLVFHRESPSNAISTSEGRSDRITINASSHLSRLRVTLRVEWIEPGTRVFSTE